MSAARSSRDFRNLANISDTASTSRILNLNHVYVHCAGDPDYVRQPFFQNPKLNKAILIKHSLRPNEMDLFGKPRRSATKIILPFESQDLRLGGESLFVDQVGFDKQMRAFVDVMEVSGQKDLEVLRLLDSLPSLDPFILRESLGRQGIAPASCYLKISSGDIAAMIAFANAEIERLINIAFAGGQSHAAMRFTGKILADRLDHELEPLKDTLRLNTAQFSDGIFSWRGFLYFKWRNLELREHLRVMIENLMKYRAFGMVDKALQAYLDEVRPRLLQRIMTALDHVGQSLLHYDEAYAALIEGHDPAPFRHFLLEGPKLFYELGEHVGILTHIASFWSYRMGAPGQRMTQLEYADTLHDFDQSLACVFIEEER